MEEWLYVIIFEHDTTAGRLFDVLLIISILGSVLVVMLDSVATIRVVAGPTLRAAEWLFTILFTIEYLLRLVSARNVPAYARSFFGVIDLLAVLPTYLSLILPGGQYLVVVRVLRVLRVFRVFKLAQYIGEANVLTLALRQSRPKVVVFLFTVLSIDVIVGALLYLVEGADAGFTSIPRAMYWAIVTLTTVGYGDIAPVTPVGQTLAAMVMLLGYAIIAVPTGIVTVELAEATRHAGTRSCPGCRATGHEPDAAYCRRCGTALEPQG